MDFVQKKKEIDEKFTSLEKMKQELIQAHTAKMNEILIEQTKLQEEYRLIVELETPKPEEASAV